MEEATIKNTGATFTPKGLSDFLANKIFYELDSTLKDSYTILDPACGEGELLSSISEKFNDLTNIDVNIRGFDTNINYVVTARNNLAKFKNFNINIENKDFLISDGVLLEPKNLFNQFDDKEFADLIIANPPYVRTQILGAEKAQEIAKRFNLKGRVDLYYPFLIAMTNVLKTGGIIGVITSNRYLTTKSGETIRNYLLDNYELIEVIDLGDTKVFDAAVLPAIFIGRKKTNKKILVNNCRFAKIYEQTEGERQDTIKSDSLFDILIKNKTGIYSVESKIYNLSVGYLKHSNVKTDVWKFTSDEENKWIEQIKLKTGFFIGERFKVRVGVKSCADNVFIKQDWSKEETLPENVFFKPLISQENIQRWCSKNDSELKILYPHYYQDGKRMVLDIDLYPKAKAYLEKHKTQLTSRNYLIDAGRNWYELWVPQNPLLWNYPKLVFPDISLNARFYYDEKGSIVNGNCYWIVAKDNTEKDLLFLIQGIANSELMAKYHDLCFNNKLYSGRRRYLTQYIEKYPIPNPKDINSLKIIDLVKELNTLSQDNVEINELELKLNALVEKAFGF